MKLKILVTGANGQLGSCFHNIMNHHIDYSFAFFSKETLDISRIDVVEEVLTLNKPQIIINCAAYTNVQKAESHKNKAKEVNDVGVKNLVEMCEKFKIKLIHFSTDFIFDGNKSIPYSEKSHPNPINYYGLSKLNGEKHIINSNLDNSLILRVSWLYNLNSKNNFVNKIIEKAKSSKLINVVSDERGSPTNAKDLSTDLIKIIPNLNFKGVKIYNYCNSGSCSRFEFAKSILENLNLDTKVIPLKNFSSNLKRPKFSALNNYKFSNDFNINIDMWDVSLKKGLLKL